MALPRRTWSDDRAKSFAAEISDILRRPGGRMNLRPLQAVALYEATAYQGALLPMGVGSGKTLISLLCPFVMKSRRPLLLTRADLINKTQREASVLSQHWPIPTHLQMRSYEILGREKHADDLELFRPDLMILDEGHRAKNPRASVTKRLIRYAKAYPTTRWVIMSGTLTRKSILEWSHLAWWALKGGCPIPTHEFRSQLEEWAGSLDEKGADEWGNEKNDVNPGALYFFCNDQERAEGLKGVRKAFHRRVNETPGVVATQEAYIGSSLTIKAMEVEVSKVVVDAIDHLREEWETPDGWYLSDGIRVAMHARQLFLGFYSVWDPRPPKPWMEARKLWAKTCRGILESNRRQLDSEAQVTSAVDHGHYPYAKPILDAWRALKATFKPNTVARWLDDTAIQYAATWATRNPGIIWAEHVPFAERLASQTNLSYYRQKGQDRLGRDIEAHPAGEPLIASVDSCGTGRNLQKWSRNLFPCFMGSGQIAEQTIGRTHRDEQKADEVTCDIMLSGIEDAKAFWGATREAEYIQTGGQPQRLLYADVIYPSMDECLSRPGPRWQKPQKG